jgi:competence protein ComEC
LDQAKLTIAERTMLKKRGPLKYLLGLFLIIIIGLAWNQFYPPVQTDSSPFRINFLDVGQGDAMVVQCENENMLIDAGPGDSANSLLNTLKNLNINRFDMVIATHPHEDHIGGMEAVINKFEITRIMMPQVSSTTRTYEDVLRAVSKKQLNILSPVSGDSFKLGSAVCSILAPNKLSYQETNNYSIVLRVVYGNTSFLLMGDAGIESEQEILSKGYIIKSEVLKVGHHGSSSSTSNEFLRAVEPRYAVISVGRNNDYGHPHKETFNRLISMGIAVYRTDQNGKISFSSDGAAIVLNTEK